jgi:hypothetical protein
MQTNDFHTSLRGAIDDALARALGIAGLAGVALIHTLQVPDAFEEIGYLGALFIAAAAGCMLLAVAMTRTSDDRLWMAAGALPGLVLIGYLISRSVGLPGFTSDMGEWAEPPALAAMIAESTLVTLSIGVLAGRRAALAATDAAPPAPVATMVQHPA